MGRVSGKLYAGTGLLALGLPLTLSLRHFSRGVDAATAANGKATFTSWTSYGGSNSDAQYSALKAVDRSNAARVAAGLVLSSQGNNGFR